ncbi:MAG: extracellular solute-binding protein [Deltaproteobacteria bacterium]|nr:extracellular solute-binding protein [Deltaproteobacteria bacterium]
MRTVYETRAHHEAEVLPNFQARAPRVLLLFLFCLVSSGFWIAWRSSSTLAQTQPAWNQQWDKTVKAAKTEGRIVVLGPAGELIRNTLVEEFKKSFPGIRLEYAGGRSTEQATRLKAERDGGVFSSDVFIGGALTMMQLGSLGALERLEPALIFPEVKDPRYWRDGRLEFTNPTIRHVLVFSSQPNPPVVYDRNRVKIDEIDELYELLDAKWRGKVVINDPLPAGPGSSHFRWLWRILGPEKATDYFKKLRAQAGAIDRDQRRQIEWIVQGKYAWLLAPNNNMLHQLAQRGLKFGVLPEFKDYGTHIGTGAGCIALIHRAPHRNAALVFLNWFLGREGQMAWIKASNLPSRRLDVPLDDIPPYLITKPGRNYWASYYEADARRTAHEETVIKDLFGR